MNPDFVGIPQRQTRTNTSVVGPVEIEPTTAPN